MSDSNSTTGDTETRSRSRYEITKRWREKNPERYREINRNYKRLHRDKINKQRSAERAANPAKFSEKYRVWREKNKDRRSKYNRDWRMRKRHVDHPMPDNCEICDAPRQDRNLYWDHDHATGLHRGWLCNHCNLAIGQMAESPNRLRAAAYYLERFLAARADDTAAQLRALIRVAK